MSNFKIWIDNPIADTNVVSPSIFGDNSERKNGFRAGTPASSILNNTALRQANLVTTAFMNTIGTSADNLSVMSSLNDVEGVIRNYMLNSTSRTVDFTQSSSRSNIASGETLSSTLGKINKYLADLDNSSVIGCQKANVGIYAQYASDDLQKGSIERRLNMREYKLLLYSNSEGTKSVDLGSNALQEGDIVEVVIGTSSTPKSTTYTEYKIVRYKVESTSKSYINSFVGTQVTSGMITGYYITYDNGVINIASNGVSIDNSSSSTLFIIKTNSADTYEHYNSTSQKIYEVYKVVCEDDYGQNVTAAPPGTPDHGTENFDPDLGL